MCVCVCSIILVLLFTSLQSNANDIQAAVYHTIQKSKVHTLLSVVIISY